jgi:hypothetical protein
MANLLEELATLRAQRKLDLDLCHVRAAGMGAQIQQLESRLQRSTLEKVRDRLLLRYPPPQRKRLAKILTEFLEQI